MKISITASAAILLLGAAISAQGVLTYPDILYLKFNESPYDVVVNYATPGIQTFSPAWERRIGGTWDTTNPRYGSAAMNFQGVDRLLTGYPTNLTVSFTIECWIRTNFIVPTGCGTGQPAFCALGRLWGDYTAGMSLFRCYIGFYNQGANHLGGAFNGTYPPAGLQSSTANVTDGAWHHVALVFDQPMGTLTSYVDGVVDQMATGVTSGAVTVNQNFCLGGQQTTADPFNGVVDEFRYWGEARSQAQIQAGMLGELPEPTSPRAIFAAARRNGSAHHLVQFHDFSTSAHPAGITSRLWDFGDGQTSTQSNPCHAYTTPGIYNVMLTVTDPSGSNTLNFANYINVVGTALTVHSCGLGDLYVAAPPPPPGWADGFTLISFTTTVPGTSTPSNVGGGWLFGLYPDAITWSNFQYPAAPGNPFHFLNTGVPNIYPDVPLIYGPGTFIGLSSLVMDAVVVYRNAFGGLAGFTNVYRTNF